jgi:hypothetical protein
LQGADHRTPGTGRRDAHDLPPHATLKLERVS